MYSFKSIRLQRLDTVGTRLILAMTLLVVFITAVVAVFVNYQIERSFDQYVRKQELEQLHYLTNRPVDQRGQQVQSTVAQSLLVVRSQINNTFRNEVLRALLYGEFIGFGLGLLISIILSEQLIKPMSKLQGAIDNLRQGNSVSLKEFGPFEIRQLVRSFNGLTKELARIEKLRDEMVSDIAHELKTPLTKLKGQLEAIEDGIYQADELRVRSLQADLEQLQYLIQALEEFSLIRSRSYRLSYTSIKLKEFIDNIIDSYESIPLPVRNNIMETINVKADKVRLRQIIENLVNNAIKYSKQGEIDIDFIDNTLSIRDQGIGIAEEDLGRIFERLYRVEKSRNKQQGGLGLGLAIVKELVDEHGWQIEVESELDKGSTFRIKIN